MWSRLPPDPAALPPERLFRLLLQRRPSLPLAFRFAGIDHAPLRVVAVPATAFADAIDAALVLETDRRAAAEVADVVARSVRVGDGVLFRRGADVLSLPEGEWKALTRQALAALSACGPTYPQSDSVQWHIALVKGCEHPSNFAARNALGGCTDIAGGIAKPRWIDRPDRFWGCPLRKLLDGHWMAYHAARAVYEEARK